MSVKVTHHGRADFAVDRILDFLVAQAVGMVQRRTAKGIDANGNAFPAYSPSYAAALVEGGENTKVDLTVTGAYLASISERSREVDMERGVARATIGPGTGTSEQRVMAAGRARKTGKRSPPHNVLARFLERKFHHLGLTPDERKRLAAQAAKIALQQVQR
jgi:hypothetical protein